MAWFARFSLFFAFVMSVLAACGGSNNSGLFGPPCPDGGVLCTATAGQDPSGVPEGGATAIGPDASSSPVDGGGGPESDGATFGPCQRDIECPTALCNWALELCAVPAPNGAKCRRDVECAGKLCNWDLEVCSALGEIGDVCRRDVECAGKLCNWELEVCSAKQPKGGKCRRDVECASGICNQALDACQ